MIDGTKYVKKVRPVTLKSTLDKFLPAASMGSHPITKKLVMYEAL